MVDGFANTPRYVLRDGSHPTSPAVLQTPSDVQSAVIFGFSDKPEYDVFLLSSALALTPYPLVKGYLQNQLALNVGSLKLIVLDAASAQQPILDAATFQAVLEAFLQSKDTVAISHQLVLDAASSGYRIRTSLDATPSDATVLA